MTNTPIYVNDNNDWYSSTEGEINNEVWIYTANLSLSVYMETGVRNGLNNQGVEGYWLWWSDTNNGTFYNHFIQKMSMNGNFYNYELWSSGNTWYAWSSYTNTTYAESTIQAGYYAWAWTMGMEEVDGDSDWLNAPSGSPALIDPDEWTGGTFTNWIQVNDGSGWHPPNDTVSPWFDYGCGSYPNGYCMNAGSNAAGQWLDNIPG